MLIKTMANKFCSRREAANAFKMDEYVLNNLISNDRKVLELKNGDFIITSKHTRIIPKEGVK